MGGEDLLNDIHTSPPPPGALIRTTSPDDTIWQCVGWGSWVAYGSAGRLKTTWDDLQLGRYGEISLLVPIPWSIALAGDDEDHLLASLASIAEPVGKLMVQLGNAAMAGVERILRAAYDRGKASCG